MTEIFRAAAILFTKCATGSYLVYEGIKLYEMSSVWGGGGTPANVCSFSAIALGVTMQVSAAQRFLRPKLNSLKPAEPRR
jgi:hypothetical protein